MIYLVRSNRPTEANILKQTEEGFERLLKRQDLGFFKLPQRENGWLKSEARAREIRSRYQDVVFVGIGGSSLGGKTVRSVLASQQSGPKLHFLENVDTQSLNLLLNQLPDWSRTHWVFVSKSGSTLETLAVANQLNDRLKTKGLAIQAHASVISEPKDSPLTLWARRSAIPELTLDFDVGGRFSVLTPVGLLPAALMGASLAELRRGALWALEQKHLVSELSAQVLQSFKRNEWISQFWYYSDALGTFGDWVLQLWAESLAKPIQRDGTPAPRVSSPFRCVGAVDQHSVLQQLMEGERDKHVWIVRVRALEKDPQVVENMFADFGILENQNLAKVLSAEAEAMYRALEQQDISVLQLDWRDLGPECLGAAFMTFQLLIGTLGEVLDIDAFNQPGVELGKKLAQQLLSSSSVVR